jgi:hypothetical protein
MWIGHCSVMYYSCTIIENVLFEDGDVNIFCIFNSIQIFLYLKKKLLLRANILAIILLHNVFFFKCIEIILFIF